MAQALRPQVLRTASILRASCRCNVRAYCEKPDREKPVKFTTSDAAGWRAEFTRSGNIYDETPDAQPIIVSLSTAVFLWYFLWYREESDVDNKFNIFENNLYDKVDGMEEVQLRLVRENKLKRGEDVREVDLRLKELKAIRLEKNSG